MNIKEKLFLGLVLSKNVAFKTKRWYQGLRSGNNKLTKHKAYNAVVPTHFTPMIDENRYDTRSTDFDKIISQTHKHFWDPNDKKYIDFDVDFDMEKNYLVDPRVFCMELQVPTIADKLTEKQKIKLANESFGWVLSQILHGEQGAMSLSASLCHILKDPGAQEYAANQTREEARHVLAFHQYIKKRWGKVYKVGDTLGRVLDDVVSSDVVWKKIIGMQILIEGLAMGAFSMAHADTKDPLLKKLLQLVMSDEAFHHKFGKIWADRTVPELNSSEHIKVENWSEKIFLELIFNLANPREKQDIYETVGLDWKWVLEESEKHFDLYETVRNEMKRPNNIFRVLVKTLLNAHIITKKTKKTYANFVNMRELRDEGDEFKPAEEIAELGIKQLQKINKVA
jgi:hypothetical protein